MFTEQSFKEKMKKGIPLWRNDVKREIVYTTDTVSLSMKISLVRSSALRRSIYSVSQKE